MRGLSVGKSPASFELVPKPEHTGALSYPGSPEMSYEISQADPTLETVPKIEDNYPYEVTIVPTISENDEPTEEEKNALLDARIEDLYLKIDEEKKMDQLVAEIIQDATLNKEGFLTYPDAADQDNTELTLPQIQLDDTGTETGLPRETTSTVETSHGYSVAVVPETMAQTVHAKMQPHDETLSDVEKLTETVMSIHESVATSTVEPKQPTVTFTGAADVAQDHSAIDPTTWEPAFNYQYDAENEPVKSLSEEETEKTLELELNKPFINPNSFLGRLGQRAGIFEKEPAPDLKIYPTHVQEALIDDSQFIYSASEAQPEISWFEESEMSSIVEPENSPPEATEVVTKKPEIEEVDYLSQDEKDVQELLRNTMEQFTEKEPEVIQPRLVRVPQAPHKDPESIKPTHMVIRTPGLEQITLKNMHTPATRTEQQRLKEIEALKRLNLSQAHPLEVAKIAAPDTVTPAEINLCMQKALELYNDTYSIEAIWNMYWDGELRADGTMMDSAQKHDFNKLLIKTLEFVDDTQFAIAA